MLLSETAKLALFTDGIAHPDYFLWDAWSCHFQGELHLYCLALPRRADNGEAVNPDERNNYPFHVHHFSSTDGGYSWFDCGVFQTPGAASDHHDSRNVWSGSVYVDHQDTLWVGYTGIEQPTNDRPFVQNMALAKAHSSVSLEGAERFLLSSAVRDYAAIVEAGYYLEAPEQLGCADGEAGGCILAWRDPFLFDSEGSNYLAFAAKASPSQPAMGLARWDRHNPDKAVTLLPPVVLPDDNGFTQLEVPKIYPLKGGEQFLLVCATTDRQSEEQPGEQVTTAIRLYSAESITGPWRAAGTATSVLGNCQHLFGATVLTVDEQAGEIVMIAPYTTAPQDSRDLTFAPRFTINTADIGRVEQLQARR